MTRATGATQWPSGAAAAASGVGRAANGAMSSNRKPSLSSPGSMPRSTDRPKSRNACSVAASTGTPSTR
eukprot:11303926-Heterocapsa_arctica.AAC.1